MHLEGRGDDATAMLVPAFEKNPFQWQCCDRSFDHEQRNAQIEERGNRHVSSATAEGIEKQNFARTYALFEQRQTHRMRVLVGMTVRMRMRVRLPVMRMRVCMRMRVPVMRMGVLVMLVIMRVVVIVRMTMVVVVIVVVSGMHGQFARCS